VSPDRDAISRLEEAVKRLRTAYEKYFAGIDRIPPLKDREDLKRDLRRLVASGTRNTALRFRINALQASMITYEAYWDRITRRIEEGTYHRDQLRMQRKSAPAAEPAPKSDAETKPATAADRKPTPTSAQREYPDSLRRLHQAFNDARRQSGEARPISLDLLAATVKKHMAMIKQRTHCERVEFKVTVKDGKAILKAIPK
jgi:hypothetical protein